MKYRLVTGKSLAGFTLIEILVTVAIIGILAAISIALYGDYTTRARATDIVTKFDAAKSTAGANIAGETVISRCEDVAKSMGPATIPDDYARIAYAFEAVSNGNESGYRPVLTVCARAADQGAPAVKVARAAHDEFAKNMPIEAGAVLTDTAVSFALPLTDQTRVVCRVPMGGAFTACGDPVAVPALPVQQTPSQAVVAVPTPLPQGVPQVACSSGQQLGPDGKTCACPAGKESLALGPGPDAKHVCVNVCAAGSARDPVSLNCNPVAQAPVATQPQTTVPAVTCTGGQVLSADQKSCACPAGQTLQAGRCAAPQPTAAQQLQACLAKCASITNPGHHQQCVKSCGGRH